MPKYVYYCNECTEEFEVTHGMKEEYETCDLCENTGALVRIPQLTNTFYKNDVGNKVKSAIEENREVLKKMKKESLRRSRE